jgi:hypothetical protein
VHAQAGIELRPRGAVATSTPEALAGRWRLRGRQRWANQRAGLRHLIRTARLPTHGEDGAEARKRGEELAALLARAKELGIEA